jgi:alkaline phosphatase D
MQQVVRGGIARARGETGHAVKVRVRGLAPDRWYHYRFEAGAAASVTGRLRTAPSHGSVPDHLRYAFASCQQRNASHYVAHRAIANEDVDFLLHLGDYIYVSDTRTLTLDDYRSDWRRFHSNPILQTLQAAVPLVAVWDDGEFYNGVDRTGPPERLAAARAAFFEHMPVQRRRDDRLYRRFRWGRLAELFLLDTRSYRDPGSPRTNIAGSSTGGTRRCRRRADVRPAARRSARAKALAQGRPRRTSASWRLVGSSYNVNPWKLVDRDTQSRADDRSSSGTAASTSRTGVGRLPGRAAQCSSIVAYGVRSVVFNSAPPSCERAAARLRHCLAGRRVRLHLRLADRRPRPARDRARADPRAAGR